MYQPEEESDHSSVATLQDVDDPKMIRYVADASCALVKWSGDVLLVDVAQPGYEAREPYPMS